MSQGREILNAMRQGNEITALDALRDFGCFRLAARIYDLKQDGYQIIDRQVTLQSGKVVTGYRMDTGQMVLV